MSSTSTSSMETPYLTSDYSDGVLQKLSDLLGSQEMSDVILVVGTKEYPAHRLLLCLFSDVFKVMLLNKEWSEAQEMRVVLQEPQYCCDHFQKFLSFFYSGKISIGVNECLAILCLAEKYNVKELVSSSLNYMSSHIAFAAAQNILLSWLQYTHYCGHTVAAQACQDFVLWNFSAVALASDFESLELESLVWILQQNEVVIEDEMEIFKIVVSWLDLQREHLMGEEDLENTMANYTKTAMLQVRFPMMSPRQLADLLLSPLVTKYKDFLVERLALGMAYHRNELARLNNLMNEDPLMLTPRIYTADNWSSMLTIERFSYVQAYHTSTLVFSIPNSFAECHQSNQIEWVVDFNPRGLHYHRSILIGWEGTKEVPEAVLRTCRLSITCRDLEQLEKRFVRVRIAVLVSGVNAGIEHIASVTYKQHYFDPSNSVLLMDDILPYEGLKDSKFLVGEVKDTLKIRIVIEPLVDLNR